MPRGQEGIFGDWMTESKSGETVEQVGKKPSFLIQLGKEEWLREEMNRPGIPRECRADGVCWGA